MKTIRLLFQIALFGFACSSQGAQADKIYEAEDATLLEGIEVQEDSSASGGKCLRMQETGSVLFTVNAEEAGRYSLAIQYRALGGDRAQRILINGIEYAPEIGFPLSAQWGLIRHNAGLKAGENTIELRKSQGRMDIDSLAVLGPIFEKPEISPKTNTFYQNQTASDLYILVEKRQNPLLSITQNQTPMPYEEEEVSYIQDASLIKIPRDCLAAMEPGNRPIVFQFEQADPVPLNLEVRNTPRKTELTIVSFDVSHGTSVLMLLPTGKTLLIDTGTEAMCRQRVLPFLQRHHLDLNGLWITHYHEDHCGGEKQLIEKFKNLVKKDYKDFGTDEQFEFEGMKVTILNSYQDGEDENSRSLSMRMEYKGFVYTHGGDIYGHNQERILRQYTAQNKTDLLRTHVYHANHHFHGSVDVSYLRAMDPYLFIVSAEQHVYGRGAYTHLVQREVLDDLKHRNKRLLEDLLTLEVGHVVIRAADGNNWNYETYKDIEAVIPYLSQPQQK